MTVIPLGESIPPDTAHAVSVSLPTWKANVGYEEGEPWVVSRMNSGYPRFFIHKSIAAFAAQLAETYGKPGQKAILFPTRKAALRCLSFMRERAPASAVAGLDAVHLGLHPTKPEARPLRSINPTISAVLCSEEGFPYAKQYWQHTGDGVSSRRAEFCQKLFNDGLLVPDESVSPSSPSPPAQPAAGPPSPSTAKKQFRGPRRYQRPLSLDATADAAPAATGSGGPHNPNGRDAPRDKTDGAEDGAEDGDDETSRFLEERFGRNLDLSFLERAKSAIRRRIAGAVTADDHVETAAANPPPSVGPSNTRGVTSLREEDVYLYPCGMNAIFNAHRYLLAARGSGKSINFGFPYVDTLKILQKFGPGCVFYGRASEAELDELEARLRGGERFLALFCEFPGNPLLTCPNLGRIRRLADAYDFAVVVDETIGTFANINVLPYADIVVSSLTKIFSGDCNVMGGSAILNPDGRYYAALKAAAAAEYEEGGYWPEDVIFMERNSRDFSSRVVRVNANADAICDVLAASPLVARVYYPRCNESAANYEACRIPNTGGYGGLLSVSFRRGEQAVAFFDAVETAKGPSLGTNFTLTSPYVVLAHYQELGWAASLGVDPDLLRISVGLEDTDHLRAVFRDALDVAARAELKD